jgi:hypothetical protein
MKTMYLDESGDFCLSKIDPTYPMFTLAGCIFDETEIKKLEEGMNQLKLKYFNQVDLVLRSYDIRKQKKSFSSLIDTEKRNSFYQDLNDFIAKLDFTIISASINKIKLKEQFSDPQDPYDLCFKFILERSIMFIGRKSDRVKFHFESRETHNDNRLRNIFDHFCNTKQSFFIEEEIKSKLDGIYFSKKLENIPGIQIADLIAYPISKWVLNPDSENKAFQIFQNKIHSKDKKFINIGLKIFP